MASNDGLAPSPFDLLPPPPSPPPSSLPSQIHSTGSSSPPSRPIPIEIYNLILHFAFGQPLPPVPLANRLDEPPSLSHLLPLTLVSKGLRELVLPFLYNHLTIRQPETWTRLLDPTEGVLVGEGEEETRRRGWVKKLSFARGGFPVASWTPSSDQPTGTIRPRATPNMNSLDYFSLSNLEEVFIGNWGGWLLAQRDIEEALTVELDGGPWKDDLVDEFVTAYEKAASYRQNWIREDLEDIRAEQQSLSLLTFLHHADPSLIHISFDPLAGEADTPLVGHPLSIVVRPLWDNELGLTREDIDDALSNTVYLLETSFPSSKFNFDSALENLVDEARGPLLAWMEETGWTKDEAGWWTQG